MKYLVSKNRQKKKKVAHLWENEDTICRMASTSGLNLEKYKIVDKTDLPICNMCKIVYEKRQKKINRQNSPF